MNYYNSIKTEERNPFFPQLKQLLSKCNSIVIMAVAAIGLCANVSAQGQSGVTTGGAANTAGVGYQISEDTVYIWKDASFDNTASSQLYWRHLNNLLTVNTDVKDKTGIHLVLKDMTGVTEPAGGFNFTGIGDGSNATFSNFTMLKSVSCSYVASVPAATSKIQFAGSTNLEAIHFPKASLSKNHFGNDNTALKAITAGNTSWPDWTNLATLTNLSLPELSTYTVPAAVPAAMESFSIPKVTALPDNAFKGWTKLATLTTGTLTAIGVSAFEGTAITGFTWPAGVATIAASTFKDCAKLTVLTVPAAVTKINANAFDGCTTLTTLTIEKTDAVVTLEGSSPTDIGGDALTKIIVPKEQYSAYIIADGWKEANIVEKLVPAGLPENGYNVSFEDAMLEETKVGTITGTYKVGEGAAVAFTSGSAVPFGAKVVLTLVLDDCYDLDTEDKTGWNKKVGDASSTPITSASTEYTYDNSEPHTATLTFSLKEVDNVSFTATATATATALTMVTSREYGSLDEHEPFEVGMGDSILVYVGNKTEAETLDEDGALELDQTYCGQNITFKAQAPTGDCYKLDGWIVITTAESNEETFVPTKYKLNGETFTGSEITLPITTGYTVATLYKLKEYTVNATVEPALEASEEPAPYSVEVKAAAAKAGSTTNETEATLEVPAEDVTCGTTLTFEAKVADNVEFLFQRWVIEPSEALETYDIDEADLRTSTLSINNSTGITSDISVKAEFVAGTEDNIKVITAGVANADETADGTEARGEVQLNGTKFDDEGSETDNPINNYLKDDKITLIAVPDACSKFVGWWKDVITDDESSDVADSSSMDITTPELSVTVGEDNVRYTAVFAKRELNVSFTVQPNGITAAPEVALKEPAEEQVGFFCKDEITVTLEEKINNACYKFVGFYNNAEEKIAEPNAVAGTLSYDFTLEGDTAVIALYEPIQNTVTHTVTAANLGELNLVKVDGETPTAEQIDAWESSFVVDCGTAIIVQPVATEGSKLTSLKIGETNVSLMPNETDKYEIVINAKTVALAATFEASTTSRVAWKVNNSEGNIKVTGEGITVTTNVLMAVNNNTELTFTPEAEGDAEFIGWQISTQAGTETSDDNPLKLTVKRDVVVTAIFKSAITTGSGTMVDMGTSPVSTESDGTPIYDRLVQKPAIAVDGEKLVRDDKPGTVTVTIYEWDDAADPVNHRGRVVHQETITVDANGKVPTLKIAIHGNGRALIVTDVKDGNGVDVTTETTAIKLDHVQRPIVKRYLSPAELEEIEKENETQP